jgi:hypothetical protein
LPSTARSASSYSLGSRTAESLRYRCCISIAYQTSRECRAEARPTCRRGPVGGLSLFPLVAVAPSQSARAMATQQFRQLAVQALCEDAEWNEASTSLFLAPPASPGTWWPSIVQATYGAAGGAALGPRRARCRQARDGARCHRGARDLCTLVMADSSDARRAGRPGGAYVCDPDHRRSVPNPWRGAGGALSRSLALTMSTCVASRPGWRR